MSVGESRQTCNGGGDLIVTDGIWQALTTAPDDLFKLLPIYQVRGAQDGGLAEGYWGFKNLTRLTGLSPRDDIDRRQDSVVHLIKYLGKSRQPANQAPLHAHHVQPGKPDLRDLRSWRS